MKVLIAYIPVWHRGYERLLKELQPNQVVLLDKDEFVTEFPELRKDIRAVEPAMMQRIVQALFPSIDVRVSTRSDFYLRPEDEVHLTNDEVTRAVAVQLAEHTIHWETAFLRWDKESILQPRPVLPTRVESVTSADGLLARLVEQTSLSADWWRQTAAAIVQEDQVIAVAINRHTPSEHEPYYQGDIRSYFHKGELVEVNTSLHAEEAVIAHAAKQGIALSGAELYATTFPCPYCARLIAYSGIAKLYYHEGYAMIDGEEYLKEAGVEIIQLEN